MNNLQNNKMNNKPTKSGHAASKIPTSGRDSGTHSRSSSVSNLTTASDIHSEMGDVASENPEDFKLDDKVWLNGTKPGYIKFIGKTQFAPGIWAGILLDEPHGKNDGSVAGVKYFTCEPLRGVFARPAKLTRNPGSISGVGDSSMVGAVTPRSSSAIPSSRASVCSNMSGTSPGRCSRLRVGERITVSSLNGVKPGTLRYIGETDFAKGEWAGIELDEPSGKNDGSVAGKRYFTCQMKYGLFSPMHKVSRAGGTTPVSRPGSVRGTPLMRSNSRDSLSSSISNSSRASRVKLGVTSLTQKNASGGFITTASKALQEALKEKDQHIEQLLKERDLDRAEFAKVTSHFEEIEAKTSDLQRKQKETESDKRKSEELLGSVQRKLEDIQFQLEEEKIVRSDFEMQLQEKNKILKRIENFIDVESNEKFLNIKEILSGQEALSEIGDNSKAPSDSGKQKKIMELESTVKQLLAEKQEVNNQLTELQKCSVENSANKETLVARLSTTVQEKDDMITNLKNELNNNIEKVTQLIEDNRTLNEQMLLKEEQAKGHADDVIKELGEKIDSLNQELKTISSQLSEFKSSNEEKDIKISTLELSLSDQTATLLQLQKEHKHVSETLMQKESELKENVALQKSLEEAVVTLKSQLESNNDEKQKQINLLDEEIKSKSYQLNDYLSSIEEKENLISSLQQNFDSQAALLSQLQNEKKEFSESLKQKELELEEKATKQKSLEEQIAALTSQTDSTIAETQKKMLDLVKEIENLSNSVQEKEDQLFKTHSELTSTKSEVEKLNGTIKQLSEKLQQTELSSNSAIKDSHEKINGLENQLKELIQEKDDMKSGFEKEIEDFKIIVKAKEEEVQAKNDIIAQHESQISLLTEKLKKNEEDGCVLKNEIALLTENSKQFSKEKEDFETLKKEKEEEIEVIKDAVKNKENEIEMKNSIISQQESQISLLTEKLKKNEDDCCSLRKEIDVLGEKDKEISHEKENLEKTLKLKDELIADFTKQTENLKLSIDKNNLDLDEKERKLLSLQDFINVKEEENNQLSSKLQLAEQKVEMLNKDSSDHVMSLQKELSKIKEESTSTKTHLEQDLSKLKQEKEKLLISISENEKTLLEKDEIITSIEKILQEKVSEISSLSAEKTELLQNVSKYKNDSEEIKKKYEEELSNTLSEYQKKIADKEQELSNLKDSSEKIFDTVSDKEKALLEKEEILSSLQNKLKERERDISELSSQNADLLENIAKFSSDLEEERRIHDVKLSNSVNDLDTKLKERDLFIEELQNKLKKNLELVESKSKDLNEKENEINNLRTMVKENNSQFEELNKVVESSEQQLALLKEQNLKNESLLQDKELLMNDFKVDQEKQLHLKEQAFKEETVKLESVIRSKEEEMKHKELEMSNLINNIQEKTTLIESLQRELEAAKAEKQKLLNDSGSIHQEFRSKVTELEEKYSKLLEEKEKIAKEELQTRDAKKNLELIRDSLIQEKSAQEEIVKDRETKIEALQGEVNRMQVEFALHKEELQKKLDINKVEIQAALELKNQLELQHSVLEELQQQLHESEEKCKELETQTKVLSVTTSEKNQLQAQVEEFQKINREKSEMITNVQEMNSALEEQLKNNKNLMSQKETEISKLKDQLKQHKSDIKPDNLNSLKSLEEENIALKNKIAVLELARSERNPDLSAVTNQLSPQDAEEKEFLQSQVDFLNSIIVDMKQKNEELTRQLEIQSTCWDESDVNLNETTKAIAPRLFCDICDMFDLHETCDCPKQESSVDEEIPQLRRPGTRKMEERPYCNNCEMFGHWTLDCDEQEEF